MKLEKRKRKGQFFILAAIILTIMFFTGIPISETLIFFQSEDMVLLSKNLQREFPKALNFGLNETGSLNELINFSRGSKNLIEELFLDLKTLWIVAEGNFTDQNVNITAGNFLGSNTTVTLNMTNSSGSTVKTLFVEDNSTNSTLFSLADSEYNLTISFDSEEKTVTWPRDKFNFYLFISLARGKDLVKNEVVA